MDLSGLHRGGTEKEIGSSWVFALDLLRRTLGANGAFLAGLGVIRGTARRQMCSWRSEQPRLHRTI